MSGHNFVWQQKYSVEKFMNDSALWKVKKELQYYNIEIKLSNYI